MSHCSTEKLKGHTFEIVHNAAPCHQSSGRVFELFILFLESSIQPLVTLILVRFGKIVLMV